MQLLEAYEPTQGSPWNLQRVWMLHRRTGFGATWSELQRDLADGPSKSIDRILNGTTRLTGLPGNYSDVRSVLGESAIDSDRPERLIAWWIYQLYFSPHPLQEKMTVVWHNHFATSNAKVKNLRFMLEQNELFRNYGLGSFQTLLTKTLKHPAMLIWLDGIKNRSGHPNENLGREFLELFTLGVGNYTEEDVQSISRAFTGWTVLKEKFYQRDNWHDQDSKIVFGQRGNFDGDDVIEMACAHNATATRLASRICNAFLAIELVGEQTIEQLAEILRQNRLNIAATLKTLLSSQLFFSNRNLKGRIIEPESYIAGAIRAVEYFDPPASTMVLADWLQQTGRKLFYPPNVGGWSGGKGWLNTRTTIARANFANALTTGKLNRSGKSTDLVQLAEKYTGTTKLNAVAQFYHQLLTGSELAKEDLDNLIANAKDANGIVSSILASPNAQLC